MSYIARADSTLSLLGVKDFLERPKGFCESRESAEAIPPRIADSTIILRA